MFLKKMKAELKLMAADIRLNRHWYKHGQRTGDYSKLTIPGWKIPWLSSEFRTKHIVYCLLRGRTYEQIEPKVREGNEPRWDIIDKLVAQGQEVLAKETADAEALRTCAG